jgi:hypothetical protein
LKSIAISFILIFNLIGIPEALGLDLSAPDQRLHAGLSFGINSALYLSLKNAGLNKTDAIFTAAALTLFIGGLKELGDKKMQSHDLEADGAGIVLSTSVLIFF